MSHDSAALHVLEAVDEGSHRPLHDGGDGKRQEPQRGTHHLAPARVARRPALHAHRPTLADK